MRSSTGSSPLRSAFTVFLSNVGKCGISWSPGDGPHQRSCERPSCATLKSNRNAEQRASSLNDCAPTWPARAVAPGPLLAQHWRTRGGSPCPSLPSRHARSPRAARSPRPQRVGADPVSTRALDAFRVAAVQAAPVFLDCAATVEKACALTADAAARGAKLIVFPEAFVPAYPLWVWWIPAGRTRELRELYAELLEQSVVVPGPGTERPGAAARAARAHVVIGVNERNAEASGASLYNTILFFGPDGRLLGKHRKLVPTAGERLVHAQGDGSTLGVYETPLGRLGGLICWENYMPLARHARYAGGVGLFRAPTWGPGGAGVS